MSDESIFLEVGYDTALESVFLRLSSFIRASDGCGAHVYKPPNMEEARAAHIVPATSGRKKAQQVFLRIHKRKKAILLTRRLPFRLGKPKEECEIWIDSNFSNWSQLEKTIKQWSLDPKLPKKPRIEHDFGDGIALPGGRPESNRSKF